MCVAKPTRAQEELGWRTEKSLETCCRDVWRFLELDRVAKEEALAKPSTVKEAAATHLAEKEAIITVSPVEEPATEPTAQEDLTTAPLTNESLAAAAWATGSRSPNVWSLALRRSRLAKCRIARPDPFGPFPEKRKGGG